MMNMDYECNICLENQSLSNAYATKCCKKNICYSCYGKVVNDFACPFCRHIPYQLHQAIDLYTIARTPAKKISILNINKQNEADDQLRICSDVNYIDTIAIIVVTIFLIVYMIEKHFGR